jgi:hypothetical protein
MKKNFAELKKIKGVGDILAARLAKAGLDTFNKIAEAGGGALAKIEGMNSAAVGSIIEQAKKLSGKTSTSKKQKIEEAKKTAAKLKGQLKGLASEVKERFQEELASKTGKKVQAELLKVLGYIEKIEGGLESKVKKTGRNLLKAEKRFLDLGAVGLNKIGKNLKKTRKSLKKLLK